MPNSQTPKCTGPLVAVLAYDGLCTFEFGVAFEVFGLSRPEMGRDWYRYAVCGIEPGPFNAAGGLIVNATTRSCGASQGRPHRRAGMAGDRRCPCPNH